MSLIRSRSFLLALTLPCLLGAQGEGAPADLAKARALFQQAVDLGATFQHREALPLAQEALALLEAALGPKHPEVAQSLLQVGKFLNRTEACALAEPVLLRALTGFQELGDRKREVRAFHELSNCYSYSDPKASLAWILKALALQRALGDREGESEALSIQGMLLLRSGLAVQAKAALEQALVIQEEPGQGGNLGDVTFYLGTICIRLGEGNQAQDYLDRCLRQCRETGANPNRDLEAMALVEIATLLTDSGTLAAAIVPLEQSLVIFQERGNKAGLASAHGNLGLIYIGLGAFPKALHHLELARDFTVAVPDDLNTGIITSNLAQLHSEMGAPALAAEALEQALAIFRKLGNKSMEGAALLRKAAFHREQGRLEAAQTWADQALVLHRSVQAKKNEHRDLRFQGELLAAQGRAAEAVPYLEQALAYFRISLNDSETVPSLRSLARALHACGRTQESTARFTELVAKEEAMRDASFPALTEAQKLTYSLRFEQTRFSFIAHTLASGGADAPGRRACFDAWLAHKGAVLDAQGRIQEAILNAKDATVRDQAKALSQTRLQLAALIQKRPSSLSQADYTQRLQALHSLRETQEAALARASQLYAAGAASRRLDAAGLAELLPKGSAYLDFARIRTYDFKTFHFAESRYVAFVLRPGDPLGPALVDLGPAEPLDAQIQALHAALKAGRSVQEDLAALHRKVLLPLEAALAGASSFTISPSGALNLVPFELLGPSGGAALMDRGPINYVTSGRDLARFAPLGQPKGTLAILADPDFDLGLPAKDRSAQAAFPPLPGTRQEARAIARAFPKRKILDLEAGQAKESALLALESPWVLHLATHGYFLPSQEALADDSEASSRPLPGLENPMLRSGLALAGANAARARKGDQGLFSADKVLGMDLSATSLVVLSACNTGLGGMRDAEGVFGLRRAFVLAGAQTLVVTLWPVSDQDTQKFMGLFYRALAQGRTKAQALLDAKRAMRALKPHPRAWAGFVLVGNPV